MRVGTFETAEGERFVGEVEAGLVHRLEAFSIGAWLVGVGRWRTGIEYPIDGPRILAPVPEPPSLRDFFSFERHVAAGAKLLGKEVAPHWYKAPAFYFSNPASIHGPGQPVRCPSATKMLDFELEIAAVVGAGGEIAGFTLMNDWSARDVQAGEMTVGLGPAKAKDFATSLGPLIVTPDELPYRGGRLKVEAKVFVNGEEQTIADASEQHFTWPQIVAHAARDTRLRPGDVLGSGTLAGGCLLELGPLQAPRRKDKVRWLESGDLVVIEAEGLGRLETPIV